MIETMIQTAVIRFIYKTVTGLDVERAYSKTGFS